MNYNNITIKQSYELAKIDSTYDNAIDKRVAMVAIVNNLSFDEVEDWKIGKVNEEAAKLDWLGAPIKTKVQTKWNGYEFTIRLNDLSAGQMIDYLELNKEDMTNEIHTLLAILDTKEKDFAKKQKDILDNCPVTIAAGVSNFFLHRYSLSTKDIQNYSLSKMKEMNRIIQTNQQSIQKAARL